MRHLLGLRLVRSPPALELGHPARKGAGALLDVLGVRAVRVQGLRALGFRVSGFRGLGFRGQGLGPFKVQGLGFREGGFDELFGEAFVLVYSIVLFSGRTIRKYRSSSSSSRLHNPHSPYGSLRIPNPVRAFLEPHMNP